MTGSSVAEHPPSMLERARRGIGWRFAALRTKFDDRNPRFFAVLREVCAASRRGTLAVAGDLLSAWSDLDCDPVTFASLMMWELPRAKRRDFYVGPELARFMDRANDPRDLELARDKAELAAVDRHRGLPWPETFAVVNRRDGDRIAGAIEITRPDDLWPRLTALAREHGNLALKPACGRRGVGFFRVATNGQIHDGEGRALTPVALAKAVFDYRFKNSERGYVVQPALTPASELARLTGVEVLTTARVVTAVHGGDAHVVESFLKIPDPRRLTDNFRDGSTGTFIAGFDPETGLLGDLIGMVNPQARYALERTAAHPLTGKRVKGALLARAGEIVAVAKRAALAHPLTPTLGWDVAIAENGLFLIDANPDWGPGWQPESPTHVRALLHRLYPDDFRAPASSELGE